MTLGESFNFSQTPFSSTTKRWMIVPSSVIVGLNKLTHLKCWEQSPAHMECSICVHCYNFKCGSPSCHECLEKCTIFPINSLQVNQRWFFCSQQRTLTDLVVRRLNKHKYSCVIIHNSYCTLIYSVPMEMVMTRGLFSFPTTIHLQTQTTKMLTV